MNRAVRAFTEDGVAALRGYLAAVRAGETQQTPPMVEDGHLTTILQPHASVDTSLRFTGDKRGFARYLVDALSPVRSGGARDGDVGLWSWLAAAFFDTICPPREDGSRRVREDHRYILSHDYQDHYRHLVRTPCIIYEMHGEHARIVLAGSPDRHGEASEQILSRQHLLTNREFFKALDALYVEDNQGRWRLKVGAGGKGPGSLRRLGKVIRQFDLTFDLYGMDSSQILALLPREFERYRQG
ncbi:MAG: hypothetical protein L6Q95_02935 [Planctomycetes bacterium]|nr:hypothetical protein [Planctomycetota bacterium]